MDHGRTLKTVLPSGKTWEIRETNGDDDAILSRFGTALTGDNVNEFLANIIIGPEKPLAEDIKKWPVNDKYGLLFKQRIFNHGPEFIFKHTDPADPKKREFEYTEDISVIDADLGSKDYKEELGKIFRYPYGSTTEIEFSLGSKKLRYQLMTGELELELDALPQDEQTRNTSLTIRRLSIAKGSGWELVTSFRHFTSTEMAYIRSHVEKNDRTFMPLVQITNPYTKRDHALPLMALPNFLFPDVKM
jgi:hypothetical protein